MEDSRSRRVVKPRERALVRDLGTSPFTEREEDVGKDNGLEGNQPKGSIETQRGGRTSPRAEEGMRDEGIQFTPKSVEELLGMKRYYSVPALSIISPSSSFFDRASSPKRLLGQGGCDCGNRKWKWW